MDNKLSNIYWALRIALGGTAFVAGLDKFTDKLADWDSYLSPAIAERLPIDAHNFMRMVGVVEMAVGATILSGRDRLGGYVAAGWLTGIAVNLIWDQDYYDIAVRDLNMAVGAFALAELSRARALTARQYTSRAPETARAA